MVRVGITPAAFEAICSTLPLGGSLDFEAATSEHGEPIIWVDAAVVDRLSAVPAAAETISDAIIRGVENLPPKSGPGQNHKR